jgi:hypothetical protein
MTVSRGKRALLHGMVILVGLSFVRAEGCTKSPTSSSSASSSASSGGSGGSEPTVSVFLRSGGVEYFRYSGFGHFPYEVQSASSCTLNRFTLTDVERVVFNGRAAASCRGGGVCWDISLTVGGRSYSGWSNDCDATQSVTGKDPTSGATKYVRWSDISRIDLR